MAQKLKASGPKCGPTFHQIFRQRPSWWQDRCRGSGKLTFWRETTSPTAGENAAPAHPIPFQQTENSVPAPRPPQTYFTHWPELRAWSPLADPRLGRGSLNQRVRPGAWLRGHGAASPLERERSAQPARPAPAAKPRSRRRSSPPRATPRLESRRRPQPSPGSEASSPGLQLPDTPATAARPHGLARGAIHQPTSHRKTAAVGAHQPITRARRRELPSRSTTFSRNPAGPKRSRVTGDLPPVP